MSRRHIVSQHCMLSSEKKTLNQGLHLRSKNSALRHGRKGSVQKPDMDAYKNIRSGHRTKYIQNFYFFISLNKDWLVHVTFSWSVSIRMLSLHSWHLFQSFKYNNNNNNIHTLKAAWNVPHRLPIDWLTDLLTYLLTPWSTVLLQ